MRRLLVAIATASLFAVLVAPAAHAAPTVTGSDPADGSKVHEAPDTVTITFDMPLDDSSLIKVVDGCGRQIDAENTTIRLNEMSVGIAKKPSGVYKAFYYANPPAGITGSSDGSISFIVHGGAACDGSAKTQHHGGDSDGHDGGQHDGHDKGAGDHEGHDNTTDHTTHPGSSTDHSTHDRSTGHTTHAAATHNGRGTNAGHGKHHPRGGGGAPIAGGREPGPRAAAGDLVLSDGQAILVSLGACLLLGVAGGWMVRTAQGPRKTA